MKYVLNNFYTISKNIKRFISSKNNACVSRKRINDVFDAILYKLFYSNAIKKGIVKVYFNIVSLTKHNLRIKFRNKKL